MEAKNIQRLRDLGKFDLMLVNAHIGEARKILDKITEDRIDPREIHLLGKRGADCLAACEARIDRIRDEIERLLPNGSKQN